MKKFIALAVVTLGISVPARAQWVVYDPANTVQPLVNDLRKTELGQTLADLEGAVDAGEAVLYSANGLFTSVGTTFTTPNGATVTRRGAPYLPVAAVQQTTDNFLSVSTDATEIYH